MWMPRRFRRQLHELTATADDRLAEAHAEKQATEAKAAHVDQIAATSAELARRNNIAGLIRHSLQHHGGT